MLLAVEGGGLFSASAYGYSKGLALLFLSQKNEERDMKVSPWNQYQPVELDFNSDKQLGPKKRPIKNGCSFFACFRHQSADLERTSVSELVSAQQPYSLRSPSSGSNEIIHPTNKADDEDDNSGKTVPRSILKKPTLENSVFISEDVNANEVSDEEQKDIKQISARKKVHWIDVSGKELAEIMEFETSDELASRFGNGGSKMCGCAIQ